MKYDIEETKCPLYMIPPYTEAYINGLKKNFGVGINWHLLVFDHGQTQFVVKADELDKVGRQVIKLLSQKSGREAYREKYFGIDKRWYLIFERAEKAKDLSILKLKELFNDCFGLLYDWMAYTLVFEALDYTFEETLPKLVDQKYLPDLIASPVPSFISQEEDELAHAKSLEEHARKWFWIHGSHWETKPLTVAYFAKRQKELLEKPFEKFNGEIIIEKKKEILASINASKEIGNIISINDFITPLHDRRKETFLQFIYYSHRLLGEIGRRFGYKLEEMLWFTPREIATLFEGGTLDHQIAKCRAEFMVLLADSAQNISIGDEARKITDKYLKSANGQSEVISGIPASKGKISGIVRILTSSKEGERFKNGEILVTSMTRPDFVPIMRRAAAVITNEGGLTCHAAIISRELGIPCIIGTKIATKMLEDGNHVEVDAEKGRVRILREI